MPDKNEKQLREEIAYLKEELDKRKNYDELTGLYNKSKFIESVRSRFENYPEKNYIIVCLDIEKFKFINDRFGFLEGDRLLAHIGKKLYERAVKYEIPAARIASDVFAFLDEEKNVNPETFGMEVQGWVQNYPLGTEIRIAVGIYHVEARNIPVRLMCDRARFAIATIKNNYMVNVAEYNKTVRDYMISQNELLNDVEKAFSEREFKVYLQPKFDIRTNKVVGAESLVRWEHPQKGLVPPKDFIPLFEQNMLITRLDEYVWEDTCRLIRSWIDKGYGAIPVSVNVSRLDMYALDVTNKFLEFTEKYRIDRSLVEIEITESAFTNDEEMIIKLVDDLRGLGFKVLLDDFGSGYSSLNILKDINVDVLKIDARFLEFGDNAAGKGREIFESVVRMAKWIGLKTIAEGVETDEQKHFLLDLGCYYAQGFYFSRPIPEEAFEELIKNPDNVMTEALAEEMDRTIAIEELFHSDFMTENLLNNILGGVAIYTYDGKNDLRLMKANNFYYDLTKNYLSQDEYETTNILDSIYPYDREKIIKALRDAKNSTARGAVAQIRNFRSDKRTWLTVKIFYLAEKEDRGMYYASVTDSTEQMRMMYNFSISRRSFEMSLELIDAVVAEYSFKERKIQIMTKPRQNQEYIRGYTMEGVPYSLISSKLIHPGCRKTFIEFCNKVRKSKERVSCTLKLLHTDNVYKSCDVNAKTMFEDGHPIKTLIVVKYNGAISE